MSMRIRRDGLYFRRKGLAAASLLAATMMVTVPAVRAADSGPVTAENLDQRIESAKTAADHEALAAYFHGQAKESAEEAKRHEAMLASYKKVGGKMYQAWENHCKSLIHSYSKEAKDYEMLAKEHEKMAKVAGK